MTKLARSLIDGDCKRGNLTRKFAEQRASTPQRFSWYLDIVAGSGAFTADCGYPAEWKASCQNVSCMEVLGIAKRASRPCRSVLGSWGLVAWVFCNVGEVEEVYDPTKRERFDLALMFETKLKVWDCLLRNLLSNERTGQLMICAVKGQTAYMIDELESGHYSLEPLMRCDIFSSH